jgi:hypothetical protein
MKRKEEKRELHGKLSALIVLIYLYYNVTIFYFILFLFIWFVRLLTLRPLLAYCASLG